MANLSFYYIIHQKHPMSVVSLAFLRFRTAGGLPPQIDRDAGQEQQTGEIA
jgi:hypothetical protein